MSIEGDLAVLNHDFRLLGELLKGVRLGVMGIGYPLDFIWGGAWRYNPSLHSCWLVQYPSRQASISHNIEFPENNTSSPGQPEADVGSHCGVMSSPEFGQRLNELCS